MLSSTEIAARYAALREQLGPAVTIVAATKYVAPADMALLAAAGIEHVGENRAQALEEKVALYGDTFRWHFIGRLQSNKTAVVNAHCELVHSVDSLSTARRLELPALVQVNLAGERSKGGITPDELDDYLAFDVRGLSTMPPQTNDPERSRPWFSRLSALASSHGLSELSMGTTQDFAVAAQEGATYVRVGSFLFGD